MTDYLRSAVLGVYSDLHVQHLSLHAITIPLALGHDLYVPKEINISLVCDELRHISFVGTSDGFI